MPSTFEFCLPTSATSVPDHPVWLHEVKYDGYRLRLERDGNRVRLITRGGYNWVDRYLTAIASAWSALHFVERNRAIGDGGRAGRQAKFKGAGHC